MDRYEPAMLDMLCLTGEVGWARLSRPAVVPSAPPGRLVGTTPVALFLREHAELWQTVGHTSDDDCRVAIESSLSTAARSVLETLSAKGASFLRDLVVAVDDEAECLAAIGELVAVGMVASDGFAGLRAIVKAATGRRPVNGGAAHAAGRWSRLETNPGTVPREAAIEAQAWSLLHRYGVMFHRLLARETNAVSWRELARVYRRLEARGQVRGGRFVSGMSGEQFALPEAVAQLREVRRTPINGRLLVIGAADPLNLTGTITTGERVRAVASSRVAYRDGVPIAALEGEYVRPLVELEGIRDVDFSSALTGRQLRSIVSGYVGPAH
jgi:ATP-dependent Lhr-like helicase